MSDAKCAKCGADVTLKKPCGECGVITYGVGELAASDVVRWLAGAPVDEATIRLAMCESVLRTCENCAHVHVEERHPDLFDPERTSWTASALPTIRHFCRRYPAQTETGPQYGCGEWKARTT